ncbi:hypothetical protein, partial [Paramuribaculum intestinale]
RTGVNLNDFPGGNLSGQPGGKFTEFFQFAGKIEKIRIPLNDGNLDLTIKNKDADKIEKMIKAILNASNK